MTGPVMVMAEPQELFTAGGVGTVCASSDTSDGGTTIAGKVNVGGVMV